ncbi:MAG: FAD-dependent oxidoreductase [Cyclobacteriaceae bacterium]|nr:FAD-dependent oxidoreductase [Cyclobacteriaceae bacterium]MDW8331713.1 FAD-dependent oxidoreductase [Cyclobacteriaceae bacterium]
MNTPRIVVLGSNFGGATAALELKRKLKDRAQVTVISPNPNFLFIPSLIWVPFGRRKLDEISFPIRPVLENKGIRFIEDAATRVKPGQNKVETTQHGNIEYDYLVISTGIEMDFNVVENLHPDKGYVENIVIPRYAERAAQKLDELTKNPGPVVVGATQFASCMGAAYEYLFNLDKELRKRKVRDKVSLTWFTPEPFLGHFGIGGITGGKAMLEMFMKMYNINWYTNASVSRIEKEKIILQDGKELSYKMAMIMPPFIGTKAMFNSPELVDEKGFVVCNEGYQHVTYKNIYAVGLAVEVPAPFECRVPFGVPKTGYPTEVSAKIAVQNIVNEITGRKKFVKQDWGKIPAICVMDAGYKEVIILGSALFKPRKFAVMIPNILNDWTKVLVEKYFLFKFKLGLSMLP